MGDLWSSPVSDGMAAAWLRQHPGKEQTDLSNPFSATAQTVRYMCRLVAHSLSDPVVWAATEQALKLFAIAGSSPAAIWAWVKYSIEFVHHQELLERWLGKGDELQLLISPEALLKMQAPKGDCAVFTTLICAMLQTAGYQWEIVTVACDPRQAGIFSHVFPRAVLPDGRRIALDSSHGQYPGWEVPQEDRWDFAVGGTTGTQIWNQAGQPIADRDSGYRGLHGYGGGKVSRGMGCGAGCSDIGLSAYYAGLGRADATEAIWTGLGACGDCLSTDDSGDCNLYDTESCGTGTTIGGGELPDCSEVSVGTPCYVPPLPASSIGGSTTGTGTPLSPLASQELAQLSQSWTKIAGNLIAPQTTIQTPSGLQISTPASSSSWLSNLFGGSGTNLLGSGTGSLGSIMPWLLVGLGLVLILPALSGGRK